MFNNRLKTGEITVFGNHPLTKSVITGSAQGYSIALLNLPKSSVCDLFMSEILACVKIANYDCNA